MDSGTALVWANSEFGFATFGDKRRTKRAVRMAADLIDSVGSSISTTCGKSGAQAVSRFFSCESVTEESTLSCHKVRSIERCNDVSGRILAIQDTTSLDFSSHKSLEGLGPTSTGKSANGIMMHSVLLTDESKVPLGILGLRLWCRDMDKHGQRSERRSRSTMEKESSKWLWGVEQVNESLCSVDKEVVVIGDRESDLYDLFAAKRSKNVHLLVRVCQNRTVEIDAEQTSLLDAISKADVLGSYDLQVESQNRVAHMLIKSCRVWLRPPKSRKLVNGNMPCLWVVEVTEVDCPEDKDGLHWVLLTTLDACNLELARYVVECYSGRWSIEEFHRTLKSGCQVERLQFENLSRLRPAIAMLCVVAQQVMFLTKYARSHGDEPASRVCTEEERDTAEKWVLTFRYATYSIATVRDYVRAIGFIGGFHGRKCDGEPGVKSIWQGIRDLNRLVAGRRMKPFAPARRQSQNAIKD
jgi:hypothetical protein